MKTTYIYIALVVLLVVGLVALKMNTPKEEVAGASTPLDGFAQCLSDAGAKFYGAFWCPHCKDQKELLKNSTKMPYIECSTPNRQGQLPVCIEAKITGYPTWDFADGSREEGNLTLEKLAEKTNCVLPSL